MFQVFLLLSSDTLVLPFSHTISSVSFLDTASSIILLYLFRSITEFSFHSVVTDVTCLIFGEI